jgi:calcyphosin
LRKRGVHGIRGAGVFFKRYDKNHNGTLERDEFTWALKEAGIVLTKTESDNLFKYFDKNNDNLITYQEFLRGVRGDLYN